jgi:RND family efflux transporter MFP subunit
MRVNLNACTQPNLVHLPLKSGLGREASLEVSPGGRNLLQALDRVRTLGVVALAVLAIGAEIGCKSAAQPAPAPPQAMPVMVAPVSLSAVPTGDTYVATIKSRRTATISPQVDGNITKIFVVSGQAVKAGQVLMQIDPLKQVATVEQQIGSQAQANASYQFNKAEVDRQKRLFDAGITSRQEYDTAVQNFESSKAAYDASAAGTASQKQQLAYYQIRAPFAGIVGDIPVHVGDYVTEASIPSTVLTTVDDQSGLEAYIYIPTERMAEVKIGLPVEILDTNGVVVAKSTISFVSPQVDNGMQGILAKAEVPSGSKVRNLEVVNARVTWNSTPKPTVPVLAVTQIGGQSFVYVAAPRGQGFMAHQIPVTLGETVGNTYPVLGGLKPGDQVIVSGLQFLGEGAPVTPMHGPKG